MRVGVVPEPASQVEEEKEAERVRSGGERVAAAVQLSLALQFRQRVLLRVLRTAASSHAASRRLPGLLLARHDRTAGVRPVPRTLGRPHRIRGARVRAAVVCGAVSRRRTRQLLLDGGRGRAGLVADECRTGRPLRGRGHPTADGASAAPSSFLLRPGRLRVAGRSDRM